MKFPSLIYFIIARDHREKTFYYTKNQSKTRVTMLASDMNLKKIYLLLLISLCLVSFSPRVSKPFKFVNMATRVLWALREILRFFNCEERFLKSRVYGYSTTIHKILRNSSFYVKQRTTGKVEFPFFSSFLLILSNNIHFGTKARH